MVLLATTGLLGTVLNFRPPPPHHPLCVPTMTPGILIRTNLNMHYLRMLLHNLQLFWSVCFVLRRTCFVLMVLMATTGLLQCLVSHVTFPVFLLGSKQWTHASSLITIITNCLTVRDFANIVTCDEPCRNFVHLQIVPWDTWSDP